MKRALVFLLLLVPATVLLAVLTVVLVGKPWVPGGQGPVEAQLTHSDMQQRLNQLIDVLKKDPGPEAVGAAIDDGMEILYGGLRPLPSKDLPAESGQAHVAVNQAELKFAKALEEFVQKGKSAEAKGRALDLKLFIEQMNEVAEAVGQITAQCGNGDLLANPPCDQLHPLLDEETGQELPPGSHIIGLSVTPGFSVKLRSPFVPPWFTAGTWEEDVQTTEAIADGECAVVFKETRGLMVRLHFQRIITVTDPWVSTFGVPRGTPVPIWVLEFVPAQYGKEWNFCNQGGTIVKTVTRRVVQDIPLNFFWRFYPASP